MPDSSLIEKRKSDHISINLERDVQSAVKAGFEHYRLLHNALPELSLQEVNPGTRLFGKELRLPLLISSMTGGTPEATEINRMLARAAQGHGLAMGLGSQRAALEIEELVATFQVRALAPDIALFANLGAVQLNYGLDEDDCQRVVDMAEADALFLHLNALQEAVQPEGETDFRGLLRKIERICRRLSVPVVAKEVGWGISAPVARQLADAGVLGIDVAGAGGTSWSEVEKHRLPDDATRAVAEAFRGWGIPTADALVAVRAVLPDGLVIASGGISDGITSAIALALGADMAGMAGPFLRAAAQGEAVLDEWVGILSAQIRIAMFATGSRNLAELRDGKVSRI